MGDDLLELVHLVPLVGELADPLDELLEVHLAVTVLVENTWRGGRSHLATEDIGNDQYSDVKGRVSSLRSSHL